MNMNEFLSYKEIVELVKAVGHERTILVRGENGIGKTSLFHTLAADPQFKDHICVAPIDCPQISDGSLFMPDIDREHGVSRELPNERLGVSATNQRGVPGSRPVLIGFDEVAKISSFKKSIIAPFIYDRRAGIYRFPEGSVVITFSNLSMENLGDTMEPHMRTRQIEVKMRKPTKDEYFAEFAIPHKMHSSLLACCEEYPQVFDSFIDYMPGGKYAGRNLERDNPHIFNPNDAGQEAYVSMRTLHAASDLLHGADRVNLNNHTLEVALIGTVGRSFAEILMSYIKFGQQLPHVNDIRADADNAPLPRSPVAQQVLVFKLINNTKDRDDAEAFTRYVTRLQPEMHVLFCRRVSDNVQAIQHYLTVAQFGNMMAQAKPLFRS